MEVERWSAVSEAKVRCPEENRGYAHWDILTPKTPRYAADGKPFWLITFAGHFQVFLLHFIQIWVISKKKRIIPNLIRRNKIRNENAFA